MGNVYRWMAIRKIGNMEYDYIVDGQNSRFFIGYIKRPEVLQGAGVCRAFYVK